MNTGIQDGYNLAWKLAEVINRGAPESLLETYNEERLPNAKMLNATTDRFFGLVASPKSLLVLLRLYVFPYIAKIAFSFDLIKIGHRPVELAHDGADDGCVALP